MSQADRLELRASELGIDREEFTPGCTVLSMVFGEPTIKPLAHDPALLPVFLHLGLVLILGLWIPPCLNSEFRQAARMAG